MVLTWKNQLGQTVNFERLVAVTRSATSDFDSSADARTDLATAQHRGWRDVLARHEEAWASRWRCSEVKIEGNSHAQQALRFALYHLNSAANPADEQVSIGARAWDVTTILATCSGTPRSTCCHFTS